MTVGVAIGTALLLAVFGYPLRFYRFWHSWAPQLTLWLAVVYGVLAGVGGGLIGLAAGWALHAQPSTNPALNGILGGIAGALALRVDVGPRAPVASTAPNRGVVPSKDAAPGNKDAGTRQVISALSRALEWIRAQVDDASDEAIQQWLEDLNDDMLEVQANLIRAKTINEVQGDRAKKQIDKVYDDAIAKLRSPRHAEREEGREILSDACYVYLLREQQRRDQVTRALSAALARAASQPVAGTAAESSDPPRFKTVPPREPSD